METQDRFKQCSWLHELAGDIARSTEEGTAEDAVEYTLDYDHGPNDRIELPSWFDENDRRLLTNMVRRRIA